MKTTRSALRHGTLAVGQIGLAETLQILIGQDHTTPEGMELAKRIEQLFKDRCAEFKEQYKLNFGVYYTPAENLCYTAMTKFKEKYGEIPNVSDRDYFTNSIHVPVWKEMSSHLIRLILKVSGFWILFLPVASPMLNLIAVSKITLMRFETLVHYAMEHDILYFAINVPNDTCLECGFMDEFNDHCPVCGSHHIQQQLRRVTVFI